MLNAIMGWQAIDYITTACIIAWVGAVAFLIVSSNR